MRKDKITDIILKTARAMQHSGKAEDGLASTDRVKWPITCIVGPGLEGAIACETKVGFVNGGEGSLIYQGYDIVDLCAFSSFEEVSYLLLHGQLPTRSQFKRFNNKLVECRFLPNTLRMMMSMRVEELHPMAALRFGENLMRQRRTWRDSESARPSPEDAIAADEDSIAMETRPRGEEHAIYEFKTHKQARPEDARKISDDATSMEACAYLISGMATLTAAIARIRANRMPIEPDPSLSHAANFLYMMTGKRPSPEEERIMDVALILHADHGMNASTFSSMVVASTLSDIYFSIGAGLAALNGPLHGGANEQVVHVLREIGGEENVVGWYERARKKNAKIPGFGHRVYKTYDPRAVILKPLLDFVAGNNEEVLPLIKTARMLEKLVVEDLGKEKKIFPNVDFYSGLIYSCLGIPEEMFTPIFAVSRVAGWTARVHEYLKNNRIFRPRAMYIGEFNKKYIPVRGRDSRKRRHRRSAVKSR
ncbi:MAG: citrate/2-methylcitrate synthase [Lentisphaerae bacterium]|nr:citrate/2-methylcitrate synthase [Lentisphaerota bacterium]